jgi:predicted nuclease with TOPRIM domain
MIIEISSLSTALSHALNAVKNLSEVRDETKLAALEIDLRSTLLDVQEKQLNLIAKFHDAIEENEALKKELDSRKQWENEKQRYTLIEISGGIYVYSLKPESAKGEPMHHLCATCFDDLKKSILHRNSNGSNILVCQRNQNHCLNTETYA